MLMVAEIGLLRTASRARKAQLRQNVTDQLDKDHWVQGATPDARTIFGVTIWIVSMDNSLPKVTGRYWLINLHVPESTCLVNAMIGIGVLKLRRFRARSSYFATARCDAGAGTR
jgi:hypothetical protein